MKKGKEVTRKGNQESVSNTLRLTFSYEGNHVKLISQQSIEMVPPPSDPLYPLKEETGFWYELKDSEDCTLYRRIIQNPIKFVVEVRSDEPDRPLTWEKVKKPSGIFVLTVPDLEQAHRLVLFSSPLEAKEAFKPSKEIARFTLEQYPKRREAK